MIVVKYRIIQVIMKKGLIVLGVSVRHLITRNIKKMGKNILKVLF